MREPAEKCSPRRLDGDGARLERQREGMIVAARNSLDDIEGAMTVGTANADIVPLRDVTELRLTLLTFGPGLTESRGTDNRRLDALDSTFLQNLRRQFGIDHQDRDIGSLGQFGDVGITLKTADLRRARIDRVNPAGEFGIDNIAQRQPRRLRYV